MLLSGKQVNPYLPPPNLVFSEEIQFRPGMKGTRAQIGPWNGLLIHYTGGERPTPDVVKTLKERGLSVHFTCESDGRIVQLADLTTRCSHAGIGNQYFIGVEVVCRGFANKIDLAKALLKNPDLRRRDEIDWAVERDVYTDTVGIDRVNFAAFNPKQIQSVAWLAEELAARFKFPRRIPAKRCVLPTRNALRLMPVKDPMSWLVRHEGMEWLPAFDRDEIWRPKSFKGALGHFHINDVKCDPGTQIFYELWRRGWNPAEVPLLDAA